ncbi:MAG: SWIB/MDM2 domain-containing protein [Gemmatimonadaceae bacterium]|jgi:upstream activation factor subunit UAF30
MASTKKSGGKSGAKKGGARGGASKKGGARKGASAKKGAAKKGAAKKGGRSSGKKAGAKKSAAKRTPNPAFMRPMTPSAQLGAVVGEQPQPRTEITKRLWAYIKRNNLQDAKERRMIVADDKLRALFKKDRVSMFDMTKIVNKHLS